jgi:hypothetical protein
MSTTQKVVESTETARAVVRTFGNHCRLTFRLTLACGHQMEWVGSYRGDGAMFKAPTRARCKGGC